MTTRSERPLGAEASVYIRERLITGKSLAHALHEALDIESGRVFGYLPDSLPDERAHQFRYGGIWPTPPESTWLRAGGGIMIPTPNAVEWLTSRALDFLSRTTKAFVVFEEWTARPSDPFWGRQPEHREAATFVGDEVYYVVSSDDRKRVQDAIEWADGAWPGLLGVFAVGNHELQNDARHWADLAAATVELAIGAYDGESYLIWTPK